jgi:4-amino-4-deoxy-L-arabinose transferase-like glycosyltransferase
VTAGTRRRFIPGRDSRETQWLVLILLVGAVLRLAMALYLGDRVEPTPAAYDQIFYHDLAVNLLAGEGFVFDRPPWPFIEPGAPTAYYSFLYPRFLAAVYWVAGSHPLAVRVVQALLCSLVPWLVYGLVRRMLGQSPAWQRRAGTVALVAAGITAGYAYFVYYSATLMTEGLYLLTVAWALVATLDLADAPTLRRWLGWALAVGLATLLRQVFMPMAGLLLGYILWKAWRRVRVRDVLVAAGVGAVLILPWTVRNYLVFDRFLPLNSQAGQVLWNANHPDLGTRFDPSAMFPVPEDLRDANEVELSNELLRRGWKVIAADPWRFLRLSLSRAGFWVMFWPSRQSSVFSNVARTASFGVCLPFMIGGLVLSLREWRRWLLLYLFIVLYTLIHVISWVQIRYRMPVDVALVPFAALAGVGLVDLFRRVRHRDVAASARQGGAASKL